MSQKITEMALVINILEKFLTFLQEIMEILEFKYFSTNDPYDVKWEAWSRVYEYPFVIKWLQTIKLENHGEEWDYPRIHNTGC